MSMKAIPEGYHTVTPYLLVYGASDAIDFYCRAFGAVELLRMTVPVAGEPPGTEMIAHAEIRIGDSIIMLSDEWPSLNMLGPSGRGGATGGIMLYVEDVDASVARAVEAGAVQDRPVEDQFYGDRSGSVTDPFGHRWQIATHIEDMTPDELQRRMRIAFGIEE